MASSRKIITFSNIQQPIILITAMIIIIGDRLLILLHDTKSFHNLPVPSLSAIDFIFSIVTLVLLVIFYYDNTELTRKEIIVFSITLVSGTDIILSGLFQNTILGPLNSLIAIPLQILLFLYLGITASRQKKLPNGELVIFLVSLGYSCVFLSRLLETLGTSYLPVYLVLTGNLVTLASTILFSTTAILVPYLKKSKSLIEFALSLAFPLFISFILVVIVSSRQLMIQIVTTSLAQTLNLTIFREIPGSGFDVQLLFLMLCTSAIFLTITGLISLFVSYNDKKAISWLLILIVTGLEIFTPYINVFRLLAIFMIFKERTGKKKSSEVATDTNTDTAFT
ncbi:MAG: hypothetical protein ACXAEU_01830 [Candidatus Hodarchaeales archaeon]|jgi:hypothetical protein